MIDRSAVQCLLDMLVSDCTLVDTRLGCFQAARQHQICRSRFTLTIRNTCITVHVCFSGDYAAESS